MKKIKGLQTLDLFMILVMGYIIYSSNYAEMDTKTIALNIAMLVWVIMLVIRLYIENFYYKDEPKKITKKELREKLEQEAAKAKKKKR